MYARIYTYIRVHTHRHIHHTHSFVLPFMYKHPHAGNIYEQVMLHGNMWIKIKHKLDIQNMHAYKHTSFAYPVGTI